MKKIILMGLLASTLCATAQTTGSLYPQNKSVFNHKEYGETIRVSYDNLVKASDAKIVLTVGNESRTLIPVESDDYGFDVNIVEGLNSLKADKNNTVFSIVVNNVENGDTIPAEVEKVSGSFLYRDYYPTATADPANGAVLTETDTTVTVTFNESVKVEDIYFLSGSRMMQYSNYAPGSNSYARTEEAIIKGEYWNLSSNPANMEVRMGGVTVSYAGENWLVPDYVFNYTYELPAKPAEYVGCDPDPKETSAWDVYMDGWGFVNFLYSDEISVPEDATATIVYYLTDGDYIVQSVSYDELWADWDWWTGYYAITVPMASYSEISENTLDSIVVLLSNVGEEDESVRYTDASTYNVKKTPNKEIAGIGTLINNTSFTIYDVFGNIVLQNGNKDTIDNLPSGLYVVNGKKFLKK